MSREYYDRIKSELNRNIIAIIEQMKWDIDEKEIDKNYPYVYVIIGEYLINSSYIDKITYSTGNVELDKEIKNWLTKYPAYFLLGRVEDYPKLNYMEEYLKNYKAVE